MQKSKANQVPKQQKTKNPPTYKKQQQKLQENVFLVEEVIGKKPINGKTHYLVKWKDYGEEDNTWEPEENLKGATALVEEFELKLQYSKYNSKQLNGLNKIPENKTNSQRELNKERIENLGDLGENKDNCGKNIINAALSFDNQEEKGNLLKQVDEQMNGCEFNISKSNFDEDQVSKENLINLNTPDESSKDHEDQGNCEAKKNMKNADGKSILNLLDFDELDKDSKSKANKDKDELLTGKKRNRNEDSEGKEAVNAANENIPLNEISTNACNDSPLEKKKKTVKAKKRKIPLSDEESDYQSDESFLIDGESESSEDFSSIITNGKKKSKSNSKNKTKGKPCNKAVEPGKITKVKETPKKQKITKPPEKKKEKPKEEEKKEVKDEKKPSAEKITEIPSLESSGLSSFGYKKRKPKLTKAKETSPVLDKKTVRKEASNESKAINSDTKSNTISHESHEKSNNALSENKPSTIKDLIDMSLNKSEAPKINVESAKPQAKSKANTHSKESKETTKAKNKVTESKKNNAKKDAKNTEKQISAANLTENLIASINQIKHSAVETYARLNNSVPNSIGKLVLDENDNLLMEVDWKPINVLKQPEKSFESVRDLKGKYPDIVLSALENRMIAIMKSINKNN